MANKIINKGLVIGTLGAALLLTGCDRTDNEAPKPETNTPAESTVVAEPSVEQLPDVDWLKHGLNDAETRFSPLDDINSENIDQLSLAWHFDYPTNRGMEATPIVHEGVIYSSGSWSIVYANDAATGETLWIYDPKVPRDWAVHACCDVVNRGVALDKGKVFVGTLDGRLLALDAATGELIWETLTINRSRPYTITGAPRVVKDKVIIGNGGSEYGVRGYVSAYDTKTGEQQWRFYTVPGNPEQPFENQAMEEAAKTWGGGPWWEVGGGGTVWDSMAYDPELNLLYIGVGNGSPWNREIRSPDGGDNLYLSSMVALNPDDGSYVWHYQTTPGDSWDYTATQHMILADLEIEGELRKVIMQAPKNGFFYVIDRATGEFISAKPYGIVTWASHVDQETGRPVESENARYINEAEITYPAPFGAHNWHPMSFNPEEGLVYIPAQDLPHIYEQLKDFEYRPGYWNTGTNNETMILPDEPKAKEELLSLLKGHITAWDPVKQEERWRFTHEGPWNGGILSTAGNLVFQGNVEGQLVAYSADKGEKLWQFDAQTGIVAPPMTWRQNGEQYIAVNAGWGGTFALALGREDNSGPRPNYSRLLVFKLGGKDALPAVAARPPLEFNPPEFTATKEQLAQGRTDFQNYCSMCHGSGAVAGGTPPDLRALTPEKHALWDAIVLGGMHWQNGMVGFGKELSKERTDNIHQYVIERAIYARDGYQPPEE